jgi:inorganic pyrophosphatase
MQLDKLPTGPNPPHDVYVVIEIPANGPGIKLELEKSSGALLVDRFLATPMHYPCDYGFIPHTLSLDGDPLDALVVCPIPLIPGVVIRCRPIAVLNTVDDAGPDAKILCVPARQLTAAYESVREKSDLPVGLTDQIEHFFAHYKDLETGKWMRVSGWGGAKDGATEIAASIARYQTANPKPNF